MLSAGIEPTGMILHNIDIITFVSLPQVERRGCDAELDYTYPQTFPYPQQWKIIEDIAV